MNTYNDRLNSESANNAKEEGNKELWRKLGLPEPDYSPPSPDDPEPNQELLRAWMDGNLPKDMRDRVSDNIARYKNWFNAAADIGIESERKRNQPE